MLQSPRGALGRPSQSYVGWTGSLAKPPCSLTQTTHRPCGDNDSYKAPSMTDDPWP